MIFFKVTSVTATMDAYASNDVYFSSLKDARAFARDLRADRHDYAITEIRLAKISRDLILRLLNHNGFVERSELLISFVPCCDGERKPYPAENEIIPRSHSAYCTPEKRAAAKAVKHPRVCVSCCLDAREPGYDLCASCLDEEHDADEKRRRP